MQRKEEDFFFGRIDGAISVYAPEVPPRAPSPAKAIKIPHSSFINTTHSIRPRHPSHRRQGTGFDSERDRSHRGTGDVAVALWRALKALCCPLNGWIRSSILSPLPRASPRISVRRRAIIRAYNRLNKWIVDMGIFSTY